MNYAERCPAVVEHEEENDGAISLDWLAAHVKSCERCRQIGISMILALSDDGDDEEFMEDDEA